MAIPMPAPAASPTPGNGAGAVPETHTTGHAMPQPGAIPTGQGGGLIDDEIPFGPCVQ